MTNRILQVVFLQMFGDPSVNPNNYPIRSLENVCLYLSDGSHFTPPFFETGLPFITVKHVKDDGIDFSDCSFISNDDYERLKKNCNPKPGDVLFSKDGTVGKVVSIDFNKEFIVLSSLAIIRPDPRAINQKFLEYLLKNKSILKQATDMKSGSAIRRIIVKDVKRIQVPIPPKELQEKFASIVEQVEALRNRQKQSTQEITKLFNSLMSKAFQGVLVRDMPETEQSQQTLLVQLTYVISMRISSTVFWRYIIYHFSTQGARKWKKSHVLQN